MQYSEWQLSVQFVYNKTKGNMNAFISENILFYVLHMLQISKTGEENSKYDVCWKFIWDRFKVQYIPK